ncbi:hypothetical protein AB0467_16035 [Streptomyces sp. NPDC052095]|uniref:hypothetical protein n=1 Tax=unclassified Streptomyces TaxID=2593676 RepID=UPI00344E7AD2
MADAAPGNDSVSAIAWLGYANDVILAGSPGVQVPKVEQLDVPTGRVWNQEADGDPVSLRTWRNRLGRPLGHPGDQSFQIFRAWSFTPASARKLDGVLERLKAELPEYGWKVVGYGPDTSKNINLTADNNKNKCRTARRSSGSEPGSMCRAGTQVRVGTSRVCPP